MSKKLSEELNKLPSNGAVEIKPQKEVFESEAYVAPKPDVGVDTTVLKPIGNGGPVPIVAPRNKTIQLQPIIVPLAVVPYMSQDNGILRTEKPGADVFETETEKSQETITQEISVRRKSKQIKERVFSFVIFAIACLAIVPFVLANYYLVLGNNLVFDLNLNVIGTIFAWVAGMPPVNMLLSILFIISAFSLVITALVSLLGLIFGFYSKIANTFLGILNFVPLLIALIYMIVKNQFILQMEIVFIIELAFTFLVFVCGVIFSLVLNKAGDKIETLTLEL